MAHEMGAASRGTEQTSPRDHSIPELMRELADETTTLVRQELDLAKAEMVQKGKQAAVAVGMFAGAGLIALFALGALTACLIAALASTLPVWLSALIVGAAYLLLAGLLALVGKSRLKRATPPVPEQTVETIKEDVEWAKTQAKSVKK